MFKIKDRSSIISFLLIVCSLIQGGTLMRGILSDFAHIYAVIGQSGQWRSARFSQGTKFANYVRFLKEHIPEEGRVVLPFPGDRQDSLSVTPHMQFFLAPRQVINCPDSECLLNLHPQNTYFLVVDDFHGPLILQQATKVSMFDEKWGVTIPTENAGNQPPTVFEGFENIPSLALAAFWPISWLMLLTLSGALLVNRLAPAYPLLSRLALGYGLGLSGYSLSLGSIASFGISLNTNLVIGVTVILSLLSLGFTIKSKRKRPIIHPIDKPDFWQGCFIVLGIVSGFISVGKGYHAADEIVLWGVKGYGIASTGNLAIVAEWGTQTVPYPLHLPILIASFQLLFGEILPASKLIFPGYYLAFLLLFYHFLLVAGLKRCLAGPATLLIATTPLTFEHATIAYANLMVSFYLVIAIVIFAQTAGLARLDPTASPVLLSGLYFASAAWTRPEGLQFSWLAIAALLVYTFIKNKRAFTWRTVLLLTIPLTAYSFFWWWLKEILYGRLTTKASLISIAIAQNLQGNLHWDAMLYILRSLLSKTLTPRLWGFWGVGVILLLLFAAILFFQRRKAGSLILTIGILFLVATIGMYYLTSYDTVHDISWWVNTGLDRMLLPAVLLIWFGSWSAIFHNN